MFVCQVSIFNVRKWYCSSGEKIRKFIFKLLIFKKESAQIYQYKNKEQLLNNFFHLYSNITSRSYIFRFRYCHCTQKLVIVCNLNLIIVLHLFHFGFPILPYFVVWLNEVSLPKNILDARVKMKTAFFVKMKLVRLMLLNLLETKTISLILQYQVIP